VPVGQAQARRQGDVAGGRRRLRQYCIAQDAQAMAVRRASRSQQAGRHSGDALMTVWHNVFEARRAEAGRAL